MGQHGIALWYWYMKSYRYGIAEYMHNITKGFYFHWRLSSGIHGIRVCIIII